MSLIVSLIIISGQHSSTMFCQTLSLSLCVICVTTIGVTLICLSLLASVDSSPPIGHFRGLNPRTCGRNRFSHSVDKMCFKWESNDIHIRQTRDVVKAYNGTYEEYRRRYSGDDSWASDWSTLPWSCRIVIK